MYTGFLAATSNRVRWAFTCEITDPATNAAVDLTGATIKIAVRGSERSAGGNVLSGSNSDGHITITNALGGEFSVLFSAAEMSGLRSGEYDVGMTIKFATGDEQQMLAASLPIVDGIVSP